LPPVCFSPVTFIRFLLNQVFSLHRSPTVLLPRTERKGAVRSNIIITNTDINNGKLYVYHTAEFWYAEAFLHALCFWNTGKIVDYS
jgi:hypothetical protein